MAGPPEVCGHPRGARGVIVRPQFSPVVVGVSPKEQLRTVLNGKQIAGETALSPLTDVGHHPHLVGGGVVAPEFVAVDAVVRCEVQGVLNADAHALVGHGFAPRRPRSCIVDEADPLVTAVGGLVVNFTGFQHTVSGGSSVVTVVQTEGHESTARWTTVGFTETDGIAEHHARCATAGAAAA